MDLGLQWAFYEKWKGIGVMDISQKRFHLVPLCCLAYMLHYELYICLSPMWPYFYVLKLQKLQKKIQTEDCADRHAVLTFVYQWIFNPQCSLECNLV